eukprot:TRINITY_DN21881_c0_g1_i1.p1 TRINITY_DN21881_c0_g1~~TRINITY_DN21881_c0_g1_i1.p1  ORF type:complete len:234 (+),score=52.58 TRINITY_DN21881_c0_g1_i1:116-817(+)
MLRRCAPSLEGAGLLRRNGPALYPRVVADKAARGPNGEWGVLRNQGSDFDAWLWAVPELRPDPPPGSNHVRKRPKPPEIQTQRLTLRVTNEVYVRYCPYLVGGDQSVNGNVNRVMKYLMSEDCRRTNPECKIFIETVMKHQPPEYVVHYKTGNTWRLQEWSGAHWDEVIQALQRREYEEVADLLAQDEDVDTWHWDAAMDQGYWAPPHIPEYQMARPIQTNFKKRLKAWRFMK